MTYCTLNSPTWDCTHAAIESPCDRLEIMKSTAWPVLCSPALARYPPMLPRWKIESTAEQSRAASLFRPMLPHWPEMLVLYDELGASAESDPDDVDLATGLGFGFGFGLGLATAFTPATPTCSGASGAAPSGAETAGRARAGAAERTEAREAARPSVRPTELVATGGPEPPAELATNVAATAEQAGAVVPHLWEQGRKLQEGTNVLAKLFGVQDRVVCGGLAPAAPLRFADPESEACRPSR